MSTIEKTSGLLFDAEDREYDFTKVVDAYLDATEEECYPCQCERCFQNCEHCVRV